MLALVLGLMKLMLLESRSLKTANDSTNEHVRARGTANLVLFLTSKDAADVDGMQVAVDGTCVPF